MENNNKFKQFLLTQFSRKTVKILVWVVIVVFLILIIVNFFLGIYSRNLKATANEKLTQSFENIYNDDVFGGETPEETLRLFLEAMEESDLVLASQYFVTGNIQNQIYAYLRKIQKNGTLKNTQVQWEAALENGEGLDDGLNRYAISYKVKVSKDSFLTDYTNGRQFKIKKGEYTNIIYFVKNKSNIWKILSI